jgi:hypothetical protein
MLSENLIRLAANLGWQKNTKEDMVFGLYNDYPFTIVDGKSFKAFIAPVAGITQEGLIALKVFLKSQSRSLKLRNFDFNDNFLVVRVKEPLFSLPIEKMELIMAQLTDIFTEFDMPTTACVVCGKPASKRGLYYGLFVHLHPECTDIEPVDFTTVLETEADLSTDTEQEAESETEPKTEPETESKTESEIEQEIEPVGKPTGESADNSQ